jgi:hypothetical protein
MEIPSDTINRLHKYTNPSTITSRNLKWFNEFYYINRDELGLLEYNNEPKKFIVGKCYSFFYFNPKYKEEMPFWNSVPVGIFLGYHQKTGHPLFLALMFIPPQIRLKILDKIVSVNTSGIDMANKYIVKSGSSKRQLNTDYWDLKKYLKGSGFGFAIRSYILSRINAKPLIISYYDWWRISTFPSKFVRKLDIRAIYIMYKRSLDINPFAKGGEKQPKF